MKRKLPSWIYFSAALAAGGMSLIALAEDSASNSKATDVKGRSLGSVADLKKLLLGSWNLAHITEKCDDLVGEHKGEVWHFEKGGAFVRTTDDGAKPQSGRWGVNDANGVEIKFSDENGPSHEQHIIQILDGKRLEMLAPTQVKNGTVVALQKFTSFFHS